MPLQLHGPDLLRGHGSYKFWLPLFFVADDCENGGGKKRAGAVLLYTKKLKSCAKINFCLIVNNMKFDPSEEIDNKNAHSIIRDIVAGGEIIFSKHTKERMQERGYSTQDVEHILLRG